MVGFSDKAYHIYPCLFYREWQVSLDYAIIPADGIDTPHLDLDLEDSWQTPRLGYNANMVSTQVDGS